MRLVIVETPFRATKTRTEEENANYARCCIRDSIFRGEAPIASHLLYTQPHILDDRIPEERFLGIAVGHEWYRVAEACVVYKDYGVSSGMASGIAAARAAGVPVEYRRLHDA